MTISSIGSIPEPIPGIPQRGEVYEYVDASVGLLMEGTTGVYAAGNVLTGKGNIKDSLDSGTEIGIQWRSATWVWPTMARASPFAEANAARRNKEGRRGWPRSINARELVAKSEVAEIMARVRERQGAVGYDG